MEERGNMKRIETEHVPSLVYLVCVRKSSVSPCSLFVNFSYAQAEAKTIISWPQIDNTWDRHSDGWKAAQFETGDGWTVAKDRHAGKDKKKKVKIVSLWSPKKKKNTSRGGKWSNKRCEQITQKKDTANSHHAETLDSNGSRRDFGSL